MLEAILTICKKILNEEENVPLYVPKNVPLKKVEDVQVVSQNAIPSKQHLGGGKLIYLLSLR